MLKEPDPNYVEGAHCIKDGPCESNGKGKVAFCAQYSWSRHGSPEQQKKAEEFDCPVGGYPYSQFEK